MRHQQLSDIRADDRSGRRALVNAWPALSSSKERSPMTRRRQAILAPIAVGALLMPMIFPGAAAAEQPDSAWLPEIRASDQVSGPDLIRGRFVDRNGDGVSGRLTVTAWPTQKVLSSLAVGDSVKTSPVGKALAGRDGRFLLRIDPSVPLKEFMDDSGSVDFELTGEAANGERAVFGFPRRFDAEAATAWVEPNWNASQGAAKTLEVTLSADMPRLPVEQAEAPLPAVNKTHIVCDPVIVAHYNDRKGIVGEVYSGPNATADFEYIEGSTSTLGYGASASGSFGSFTSAGTTGGTSTATLSYPLVGRNVKRVWQSSWRYSKMRIYRESNGACVVDRYEVRKTRFDASSYYYDAASAPTADVCSNQLAGQDLTKYQGTAVTFSTGVDVNVGAVGAYLSTRTGFNSSTKIYWHFVTAGKLCGSNTSWPTAARVVGK